ncbi:Rieske (2Fe-2S) protein [Subtercola sp. PAMC28395]|uniref:QcrA and Rieske domain-containing protein n=1 Tax=Subtercola sp. PAMC28395 TaxID=2846775 RepID=UPI001C0BC5DA|nr:Rieske (2Fe-2S) protein [Subtercola sp. PAMC28395]QWT24254.1 Rieske (2Fe-2S) protein [Subtercola sp. PAMC28395]
MSENTPVTRRVVLTAGSVGMLGASALALSACAPTTSTGAAGGTASTPAASAGSGSAGEIAKLADVPVGQAKSISFGGQDILVAQPSAGKVVAFSSVCPHQGCAVAFASSDFACPCHGSTFDLATGNVTHGPAQKGLSVVAVKVAGDAIVAG